MSRKFHTASYDNVDQVIRTRKRRHEVFLQGLKRVRSTLQRRHHEERQHPQVLGGLSLS